MSLRLNKDLRCNVRASTQFQTTYLFPVPVPVWVTSSVNMPLGNLLQYCIINQLDTFARMLIVSAPEQDLSYRFEMARIRYNFTRIRDVHVIFVLFQFLFYFKPNSSLNSLISSRRAFPCVEMSSICPIFPQMCVILANIGQWHASVSYSTYIPAKWTIFCPLFPPKYPNSLTDSSILLKLDTGLKTRREKHI